MRAQYWIFSVRYTPAGSRDFRRCAVVGPARESTVEAVLHLAGVPEDVRAEIRDNATVRSFIEGKLDPGQSGYYAPQPFPIESWIICIGSVHEVLALPAGGDPAAEQFR